MTSHDVVAFIRKTFNIKSRPYGNIRSNGIGSFAYMFRKATKISQYLLNDKKDTGVK